MNTIEVNKTGYYIVKVTLSDDLYEQLKNVKIKDLRIRALYEKDDGTEGASVRASIPIAYGFLSTWELFSLTGNSLTDNLTQTFLMVGLLQASQPLTVYILKILIMLLLGGCDAGLGIAGLVVLAGSFAAFNVLRFRKKNKR